MTANLENATNVAAFERELRDEAEEGYGQLRLRRPSFLFDNLRREVPGQNRLLRGSPGDQPGRGFQRRRAGGDPLNKEQ